MCRACRMEGHEGLPFGCPACREDVERASELRAERLRQQGLMGEDDCESEGADA
jgi:hypothetical protein